MTYYHASPTGGLQILEPRKSPFFDKPTQVCLTSLRAMALFYLIRNYEYAYGYTRQGKLYFDDPFPDALKKLYAIAARYGITMTRFNWGTAYKGVDDYFLAVSQGKALRPFIPANQSIVKCAEKQEFKYIPFVPRDLNVTA